MFRNRLFISILALFGIAFVQVYVRIQSIILGYDIAESKKEEVLLIKELDQNKLELAKLKRGVFKKENLARAKKDEKKTKKL